MGGGNGSDWWAAPPSEVTRSEAPSRCAAIVAKAIRTAPRVLAVEVDYETGEAVVGTELCCPVPRTEILTGLEQAGYHGTFTNTPESAAVGGSPKSEPREVLEPTG